MKALVVGLTTEKGFKISEFLISRGVLVYGVDNKQGSQGGTIKNISRIFKLNPRHKDSMWLMFEIAKPDTIIYCMADGKGPAWDYVSFLNILYAAIERGVSKVVLVINENLPLEHPETIQDAETIAMCLATKIIAKDGKFEYVIITEKDNLFKTIKKFLLKENE
jgi:nucleoside-diphosphate-sugar epimerase